MLTNYLKTAWRHLVKNSFFSFIHVAGLTIGISASLVIYLLVHYDYSFDKYERDNDRIYRVVENFSFPLSGKVFKGSGVPYPLGNAVQKEITGLQAVAAFSIWDDEKVSVPGNVMANAAIFQKQNKIVFADENFFMLFEHDWIAGNPKTSLSQPGQVVLSESNAKLYFPKLSVSQIIGKPLYFNDSILSIVTGVVKDIHQNSDFDYKIFISKKSLETGSLKPRFWERWNHSQDASQLLIKLSPRSSASNIQTQIATLYKKYYIPDPNDDGTRSFGLQPLSDVHFKTGYDNYYQRHADKSILYGLLAVAAFLLILACINFINLATAQASQRAKEIGIRKTLGGSKKHLILLALSETLLLTLFATILSAAVTPLLLKAFASFLPSGIEFNLINQPGILVFLSGLVLTVCLLSGFYPAVILSSYKPVLALKNQSYTYTGRTRSEWFRQGLTVFQFVIAQVFIIATMLVSKQINYTLNKDLGFKKDAIINFANYENNDVAKNHLLINKLKTLPGVAMVSLSMDPPSSESTWMGTMKYNDHKKKIETEVQVKIGDTNYISLYRIKLLAGTNLLQSDTMNSLLINETYAHALGFTDPQRAVGKFIDCYGMKPVVGVVQDFNQKTLHELIKPLLITSEASSARTFNVLLQPQNAEGTGWQSAISQIQNAWKEVYPKTNFDYSFLDESIAANYTVEQNVSLLLKWATGLSIFISCLGLLALVIFVTNQRTKEIGIRKVLGSSVAQIISLLSGNFLKLITIAFLIAIPVAWYGTNKWIENFAYQTTLSWWIFITGGVIMFGIAFIILCLRTYKAAITNPAKSLRTD